MKKIIILIICIVILLVTIISYKIYSNNQMKLKSERINKEYEQFYNVEVLGTDLASLMNKIENSNEKNNIEKDENGIYIDNNKNSINLEIKFLELEEIITLEKVEQQGIARFVQNFGAMSFKCMKIEYHKNTGSVKHMYFEQTK